MEVTLLGMVTEDKPVKYLKALAGILVTLFPIFKVAILVQKSKTGKRLLPIVVQLVALKFTIVRLVQQRKAEAPMEVTLSGMVTEVRFEHQLKAELPMEVTPLGMVTEVRPVQP